MSYSASDIANYFVWLANEHEEYGENITNLKLQKLVYYAQGFSLAWNNKPLFADPIVAWMHGPVVINLYGKFKHLGAGAIPTPEDFSPEAIDPDTRQLLKKVYDVYGQFSAWGLRNLTHDEAPWKDTDLNAEIPLRTMHDFFTTHLTDG